jgi:hypothetical protein
MMIRPSSAPLAKSDPSGENASVLIESWCLRMVFCRTKAHMMQDRDGDKEKAIPRRKTLITN